MCSMSSEDFIAYLFIVCGPFFSNNVQLLEKCCLSLILFSCLYFILVSFLWYIIMTLGEKTVILELHLTVCSIHLPNSLNVDFSYTFCLTFVSVNCQVEDKMSLVCLKYAVTVYCKLNTKYF